MDAFEQLIAEILFDQGYWVQTSVKVDLTKEEKRRIERHSSPRWEIDVVAYKAASNELLVIECKSYLDSRGVQWAELQEGHSSTRYKLFKEPLLREVVFARLAAQMIACGRCAPGVTVSLAMAAGKIKTGDQAALEHHFAEQGWRLYGPDWLRERLEEMSVGGYTNQISSVVAKLLLRSASSASSRPAAARVSDPVDARGPEVACEVFVDKSWQPLTLDEALTSSRSLCLRCPDCGGPVRVHRASVNGMRAHIEHLQRHEGCPRSSSFAGTARPHPSALT